MTNVNPTAAHVPETRLDRGGRSAWGAIAAGAVVGLAVFNLLSLLGIGIGLSVIEVDADNPLGGVPTATPIWMFVSQVVALGVGGFVAGRLAGVLHGLGAMLHGAAVWGVATLAAAWLTIAAGTGLFNMAGTALTGLGNAVAATGSGVASATDAIIPDDLNLPDIAVSRVGLEDLPDPVAARLRDEGITPENFREEAREAFRNVISRAEQARARLLVSRTAVDILQQPTDASSELSELRDMLLGGENAVISEEDREEALTVMERRVGLTEQEAEAYVDQVEAQLEEARAEVEQTIDEVQQTFEEAQAAAIDAADQAADAAATASLLAALASLIGLVAAAGGAMAGRPSDID